MQRADNFAGKEVPRLTDKREERQEGFLKPAARLTTHLLQSSNGRPRFHPFDNDCAGYFASILRSARASAPAAASMPQDAPATAAVSRPVFGDVVPVSAPDGAAAG